MDLTGYIAALSVSMSSYKVQQSTDLAVMKKAMQTQEAAATNLIETIASVPPPQEGLLDIRV